MRLISLNIWGGKAFAALIEFISESAEKTDFFCFQEVYNAPFSEINNKGYRSDVYKDISKTLSGFQSYFYAPAELKEPAEGLAVFSKTGMELTAWGCERIIETPEKIVDLQYIGYLKNNKNYNIAHVHGLHLPGDKLDTPERIKQSENILKSLDRLPGEKLLCGDFNLMPDTQSIKMFEQAGYKNLIKDFGIATTRSELNYAKYPENERQYFADYMFVTHGVNVRHFRVPQIPVSDHLPMILDFN